MMLPTLNLLSGVLFVHLRIFQNTFKKYPTHFKHSVSREFLEISIELILCSLSGPFSNYHDDHQDHLHLSKCWYNLHAINPADPFRAQV